MQYQRCINDTRDLTNPVKIKLRRELICAMRRTYCNCQCINTCFVDKILCFLCRSVIFGGIFLLLSSGCTFCTTDMSDFPLNGSAVRMRNICHFFYFFTIIFIAVQ